jgi:protein phosphatase 1 regulatory subunit 32
MSKSAYGSAEKHVLKSHGGDSDIMKFYCTTNQTTFGKKWKKFEPRTTRHVGTGYVSNFRTPVYYNSRLDELDNPAMGRLVADNYHSITNKSFVPFSFSDGKDTLPNSTLPGTSGYIRQVPLHIPTSHQIKETCIQSRVASAPADILPRHKPYLWKIQSKDPTEMENFGYGPSCSSTETSEKFQGQQPNRQIDGKQVGTKEESGFTHNHTVELLTFHPDQAHLGDVPGFFTDRPTGMSITQTDFLRSQLPNGAEPMPKIAACSDHESGFSRSTKPYERYCRDPIDAYGRIEVHPTVKVESIKKQDPTEYINLTNPNNKTSVTACTIRGKQRNEPTLADRLGKTHVGWKENTGFTANNDKFVWTPDNPARFITEYQNRFIDRTATGADREGHTWGGTFPPKDDGFTRSTRVHNPGPPLNSNAVLQNVNPYVGRSIKARDTFFDDHTYDSKLLSMKA